MTSLMQSQVNLLSRFLDNTTSVQDASIVINKYPDILTDYRIDNQTNEDVLRYLLLQGCLPTESYLYRVCDNEMTDIIIILCELDVFRRVHRNDADLSIYVAKQLVADIFLKYGFITKELYDSYVPIWKEFASFIISF